AAATLPRRRKQATSEDVRVDADTRPQPDMVSVEVFEGDAEERVADEALRQVLGLLKSSYHIDLTQYKLTTVRRRVERRMRLCRMASMAAYAAFLRTSAEGLKALHDDLFIHVTQFFRDPESFRAL